MEFLAFWLPVAGAILLLFKWQSSQPKLQTFVRDEKNRKENIAGAVAFTVHYRKPESGHCFQQLTDSTWQYLRTDHICPFDTQHAKKGERVNIDLRMTVCATFQDIHNCDLPDEKILASSDDGIVQMAKTMLDDTLKFDSWKPIEQTVRGEEHKYDVVPHAYAFTIHARPPCYINRFDGSIHDLHHIGCRQQHIDDKVIKLDNKHNCPLDTNRSNGEAVKVDLRIQRCITFQDVYNNTLDVEKIMTTENDREKLQKIASKMLDPELQPKYLPLTTFLLDLCHQRKQAPPSPTDTISSETIPV